MTEWQRLDPRMLVVEPVSELRRFLPVLLGALLAGGVAMFALTFESDGEVEQPPQSGRQPWPTPWVSDRAAGLSWGSSW